MLRLNTVRFLYSMKASHDISQRNYISFLFFSFNHNTCQICVLVSIFQDPSLNVIIINSIYALRVGLKAFSNAPVVGGLLEQLLRALRDSAGASFSDFHLIGQSLGAHVVGYAGKRAQDNGDLIGRITGTWISSGIHVRVMYTPYTPLLYSKTGVCTGIPIFSYFCSKT